MGTLLFHRAEFLNCLANNLSGDRTSVHFGKRLATYSVSSSASDSQPSISLEFKDGSTAMCHVLIGADGVHSAARRSLLLLAARGLEQVQDKNEVAASLRVKIDPVWTGLTSYRNVVSAEKLRALNPNHSALSRAQFVRD